MKPKVALGLSFFQNVREIPRCLGDPKDPRSVCNNVDYIIAVDGRYTNFNWSHDFSNDGSKELIASYDNAVILSHCGTQIEKRQIYLNLAGVYDCDYLIVWDSDDYIHPYYQNWDLFYQQLEARSRVHPEEQTFSVWAWIPSLKEWERAHNEVGVERWHPYQRVIKNPGEIEYDVTHYQLKRKDEPGKMHWLKSYYVLGGVRFTTDSKLRDRAFLNARDEWALTNLKGESDNLMNRSFHTALDQTIEMQNDDIKLKR